MPLGVHQNPIEFGLDPDIILDLMGENIAKNALFHIFWLYMQSLGKVKPLYSTAGTVGSSLYLIRIWSGSDPDWKFFFLFLFFFFIFHFFVTICVRSILHLIQIRSRSDPDWKEKLYQTWNWNVNLSSFWQVLNFAIHIASHQVVLPPSNLHCV